MIRGRPGELSDENTSCSVLLGDRRIPYSIRISRTSRRLRIKLSPKGLELVLPRSGSSKHAVPFLKQNANWILKHLEKFERLAVRRNQHSPPSGSIFLRGQVTKLEVSRSSVPIPFVSVEHVDDTLRVLVPAVDSPPLADSLDAWLSLLAESEIRKCAATKASVMRLQPARVFIRDQKTLWGSCSRKGNISLNWRLIMAPPQALDYVVVHEIAHLADLSHGKRFWKIVEAHCPGYREQRRWLRENQDNLYQPYQERLAMLSNTGSADNSVLAL